MEKDYEAELEHDLLMMVTEKILEHGLKEGTVDFGIHGKLCPNPLKAFANINPRVFVNYIMAGDQIWAEVEDDFYKKYNTLHVD
jgi:hypothetical protein